MSDQTTFSNPLFLQSFDYFSRLEKPSMTLCNPDRTQLYSLNACYDTEFRLKWNAQSEFNFTLPKYVDGVEIDAFDYIEGKRLVFVENIGYFIIADVQDNFDGSVPIKTVSCVSQESELVYKKIILFSGTYSFGELVEYIESIAIGWSFGYVATSLSAIYRTFNISDTNVYQFLTNDVAIGFDCIFIFDYTDKIISAIPSDYDSGETDIFLSFENLISNTEYSEITSEITTVLYPYGGGTLTGRDVNPLGTNAIYDFTYYKTTEWMSGSLIEALNTWEDKVDSYRVEYADLLVSMSEYSGSLLVYQAELAELESDLASNEQVRAVRVQQGLDTTEIDVLIEQNEQDILNKEIQIAATSEQIALITADLQAINLELSLTNTENFTNEQYIELSTFIYENTYRNDNIIITDTMTYPEIQEQSQQLYDIATTVLEKAAIPRYEITINAINFLALQRYQVFIDQLSLGGQITVDTGRGYYIDATLLEYDFSYDNLDSFTLIISNRQRLDNSHFIFTDLFGQSIQSATSLGFNSSNWNDWTENKPTVLNQVLVPDGTLQFGLVSENLKGTIDAKNDLAIKNTNSTTGSSNFYLDQYGAVLRDATLYSGSNIGRDGEITTAGGGVLFFSKGVYIGGTGLTGSGILYVDEDLTGQTGSYLILGQTFLSNSTRVYLNGLVQRLGYSYSENGDVQSLTMHDQVLSGDVVVVEYIPLV